MSHRRRQLAVARSAVAPVVRVRPLHAEDIYLVTDDGEIFTGISQTVFTLAQAECEGWPGVDTFLAAVAASGVKIVRSLAMYWAEPGFGIGKFNPSVHPDFPQRMRSLATRCAGHGLMLQLSICADHQTAELAGINLRALFLDCVAACEGVPCIIDRGNELDKNGDTDGAYFAPPATVTVLLSRGSMTIDQLSPLPVWIRGTSMAHPNRDDFVRKYLKMLIDWRGGDTTEKLAVPGAVCYDECIGLGEADEPGRTCADDWAMWQATAGAIAAGAPLVNAHTRSSISALVMPGVKASDCVAAMVNAAAVIPTHFARGDFHRGQSPWQDQDAQLPFLHYDSETITNSGVEYPGNRTIGAKRSYCLWVGNDGLFMVIEPMYAWDMDVMLKPGFTIVKRYACPGRMATVCEVRR